MVLSVGILFHSDYSQCERNVGTSDNELEPRLTVTFEVQKLVKRSDDFVFNLRMHGREITIQSRAENRDMIWIIESIVP